MASTTGSSCTLARLRSTRAASGTPRTCTSPAPPCSSLPGEAPSIAHGRSAGTGQGRPPGRGPRRQHARRSAGPTGNEPVPPTDVATDCWFDDPAAGDRRSWAVPAGHGTYQSLNLELLDRSDEDDRIFLIEALHPEFAHALRADAEMIVDGEPFSPRLHITLHQVVASQLLAGEPAETWQTVQRLAALGYDWHNIMHMIARVISDDIYAAMDQQRKFDPGDYARRLNELPGDWPLPHTLRPH